MRSAVMQLLKSKRILVTLVLFLALAMAVQGMRHQEMRPTAPLRPGSWEEEQKCHATDATFREYYDIIPRPYGHEENPPATNPYYTADITSMEQAKEIFFSMRDAGHC